MAKPLLSVCFLSFNDCGNLYKSIVSLGKVLRAENLIEDSEFLIVDNDSRDDVNKKYIEGLLRENIIDKAYFSSYNMGQNGGLKKLFEIAEGKYILNAQSDWQFKEGTKYPFIIGMQVLDRYKNIGMIQLKYKERIHIPGHIQLEPDVYQLTDNGYGNFTFQINLTSREKYAKWGGFEELPFSYSCKNNHDEGSNAELMCGIKYARSGLQAAVINNGQFESLRGPNILKKYSNAR